MTDISRDAQMIEDEAMGYGQWLAEHPADLREHLEQWDSDGYVRLCSEALGEVSLGLALAHLSAGQAKVTMDVMVEAMWLAHAAIRKAKEGSRWRTYTSACLPRRSRTAGTTPSCPSARTRTP